MRILLISNYYYPEHIGGVEIVSHNLVKHYRSKGHDVRWMAADVPPHFRDITAGDVPVRAWNFTEARLGFPSPLPGPDILGRLYSNLRWCDIVHLQDSLYPINMLAFAIIKGLNKPVLITQYAKKIPYQQGYKRHLQTMLYASVGQWMFRSADRLAFITSNVRDGMQHVAPDRHYEVIPLGVDTDFFLPASQSKRNQIRSELGIEQGKPILLFIGRMVERKGIRLVREVIERQPAWQWILVGRPDDFNPASWNLANLLYYQNVEEESLRSLYAAADLLVHPSQGEGLTLTASESMACGTPVVVSREMAHEIDERDTGLFFTVDPKAGDLEGVIAEILADRQRLDELRPRVREYAVRRLSWSNVAQHYLEILLEIINSKDSRKGITQ